MNYAERLRFLRHAFGKTLCRNHCGYAFSECVEWSILECNIRELVSAAGGLMTSQIRYSSESNRRAVARMAADTRWRGAPCRERQLECERRRLERECESRDEPE